MAKLLSLSTQADATVIYRFVRRLAESHGGLAIDFTMSAENFDRHFAREFFKVHLYREDKFEIGGIALHMPEYSVTRGSYGCYLDDFFLEETLRGRGLGRRMLGELCKYLLNNEQCYLQVIFHESLDLEKMYKHFGFVNQSETRGLRLYEGISGDFRNILKCGKVNLNDQKMYMIKNVKSPDKEVKYKSLPVYKLVLTRGSKSCQCCCQFYFNSWLGYGLLYSDFSGDTNIVQLQDFKYSALQILKDASWSPENIRCIWWHIHKNQKGLRDCIRSCEARDITNDGWIVSTLEKEGMCALASSI